MKIFISYGRKDGFDFAKKLSAWLKDQKHEPWLDEEKGIQKGDQFDVEIEIGISNSNLLIALLTPWSVRPEGFCRKELLFAQHQNVPIIPIRLGEVTPPIQIISISYIEAINDQNDIFEQLSSALNHYSELNVFPRNQEPIVLAGRPWWERKDTISFTEELAKYGGAFYGREWLFSLISEWISLNNARLLLITADAGVGKSMLAAQMTTRFHVHGVHFCSKANIESCQPISWIMSLVHQLSLQFFPYREKLEKTPTPNSSDPPESIFRTLVVNPLRASQQDLIIDQPWVFVIDGLDEAFSVTEHAFIDLLAESAERLPPWLRIIVTSRPDRRIVSRFALDGIIQKHIDASGADNLDDVKQYIQARLQTVINDDQLSDHIDKLADLASGNFLFARMTLDALCTDDPAYQMNLEDIGKLPFKLGGLYYSMFRRRFSNISAYTSTILPLLETLSAALAPVPESLLKEACGLDERSARLGLQQLSQFLESTLRGTKLFHASLGEWLSDETLSGEYTLDLKQGHNKLAKTCFHHFSRRPDNRNLYEYHHLPSHLFFAGMHEELFIILTDLRFIHEKIKKIGIMELLSDFRVMRSEIEISFENIQIMEEFEQFLRSRSHILDTYPHLVFQDAYNSPQYSHVWSSSRSFPFLDNCAQYLWVRRTNPSPYQSRAIQTLFGHQGQVNVIVLSPGRTRILSGSQDGSIRVWDNMNGRCLFTLEGHEDIISALAIIDETFCVSGSRDSTLKIWDYETGRLTKSISDTHGPVYSIVCPPGTPYIITGHRDGTIDIHDRENLLSSWKGHMGIVSVLLFLEGTKCLISGGYDGKILCWEIPSGKYVRELQHTSKLIRALAVDPDERYLLVCGDGAIVRVYDLKKEVQVSQYDGSAGLITAATISSDGRHSIIGGTKKKICVLNLLSGKKISEISVPDKHVHALTAGKKNNEIYQGLWDGSIKVLNISVISGEIQNCSHISSVLSIFPSPDGNHFVTVSDDGSLIICDSVSCSKIREITQITSSKGKIGLTYKSKQIIFASKKGEIIISNLVSESQVITLGSHEGKVLDIQIRPDDKYAVSAGYDHKIKVWDLESSCFAGELPVDLEVIHALKFTPDGKFLITVGHDQVLNIWNFEEHTLHKTMPAKSLGFRDLLVTPDNRYVISRNSNKTVTIWNILAGNLHKTIGGFTDRPTSVTLFENGKYLAAGDYDGSVSVWDIESGSLVARNTELNDYPIYVSVLSDQSTLVTASKFEGLVKFWKLTKENTFKNIGLFGCDSGIVTGAVCGDTTIIIDENGQVYGLELKAALT